MRESEEFKQSGYTAQKQIVFGAIVKMYLHIWPGIFSRYPNWAKQYCLYIDLNSGPGRYDDDEIGSPLVFLEAISKTRLEYHAMLYESNQKDAPSLIENVRAYRAYADVYAEDNANVLYRLTKRNERQYGMVYADPSNAQLPVKVLDGSA